MTARELPLWVSLGEAATITGESRQTLWRRHRDGTLRTVRRGRTIMVPRDALLDYVGVEER